MKSIPPALLIFFISSLYLSRSTGTTGTRAVDARSLISIAQEPGMTLPEFLRRAPAELHRNSMFSYASDGTQPANLEFPRVISFANDLMIAYSGHPDAARTVQILEANTETGAFDGYMLKQMPGGLQATREHKACIGCHGDLLRPLWNSAPWAGLYAPGIKFASAEQGVELGQRFNAFLAAQSESPIYGPAIQHGINGHSRSSFGATQHAVYETATRFDTQVTAMMSKFAVAQLERIPAFRRGLAPLLAVFARWMEADRRRYGQSEDESRLPSYGKVLAPFLAGTSRGLDAKIGAETDLVRQIVEKRKLEQWEKVERAFDADLVVSQSEIRVDRASPDVEFAASLRVLFRALQWPNPALFFEASDPREFAHFPNRDGANWRIQGLIEHGLLEHAKSLTSWSASPERISVPRSMYYGSFNIDQWRTVEDAVAALLRLHDHPACQGFLR